jgi:hypothetical protein
VTLYTPQELEIGKAALLRARRDPEWWIKTTFGEPIIGKQHDILEAAAEPGVTEIDVVSCHNSGKTHTLARLVKWWLSVWPNNSKVITTAPTWNQVEFQLWREVRSGFDKARAPLGGAMLNFRWDLAPEWFAMGISTDRPANLQGFHAAHLLVVVDEADGIAPEMWNALDALVTSGHCLMVCIGNPDDPQSEWRKRVTAAMSDSRKRVIRIAADDVTPHFAKYPFMLSPVWVEEKKRLWGETGPRYMSKVLAQWPDQGSDTVIPMSWLLAAKGRDVERGLRTLGVDVARYGTDRTVRTLMAGRWMEWQRVTQQEDTFVTSSKVIRDIDDYGPVAGAVDAVGIGAGVVDNVKAARPKFPLTEFNAAMKPVPDSAEEAEFADLASQWWWAARKGFEARQFGFSMDDPELVDTLINELNQARFGFVGPRLKINKFGMKVTQTEATLDSDLRAQRSPDLADSFVLAANAAAPYVGLKEARPRVVQYHKFVQGAVNA